MDIINLIIVFIMSIICIVIDGISIAIIIRILI
jgi:hypothetical protein